MKFSFEFKDFIEHDKNSDKLAIISENEELTWGEFEKRVNNLCDFLSKDKLELLENPVVIYGHKQADFVIAVYACIKLKIPYIPIDIVYPRERIETVIKLAKVELILNCDGSKLGISNTSEIQLNQENYVFLQKKENYTINLSKSDLDPLIYLIFTSGSTGEPKGVQISTEAVISFTNWMENSFGFTSDDVFINVALFSFDLSVYELLSFAKIGNTLLLSDKTTTENPDLFLERIKAFGGTIWVSTPSFSFIYSRIENSIVCNQLKFFLFCGEMLPTILAKQLKENYPNTVIYNTYGPTEATVATTLVEITHEIIEKYNPLPVGYPKPESEIILEENEIIIVGKNVSLGYLNRPELNKDKFITINNLRAFKTGDNGYFQDGMLFCKGRNDDQVKLHGFRIELNEITSKMNEISFVQKSETIALRRNDEVKKIVSLVELKADFIEKESVNIKTEIFDILKSSLPYYMIPSDIKVIEKIPLNQNGKSDKKALEQIYLAKA